MFARIGLACVAALACATAEFTAEQIKLQYKSEEAEHLSQTLEVDYEGHQMTNEFQLIDPSRVSLAISNMYTISSALPAVIVNNGVVRVSFTTTQTPRTNDWIGAYSPANTDFTKVSPVKYALCSTDPNYLTQGVGGLNFNFTNLRSDISFHYFTAQTPPGGKTYPGYYTPVLVATSPNNVTFKHVNEALKPRIVPVGSNDPNTYKLIWSSAVSTTPIMKWGTVSGVYTNTVTGTTSHLTKAQMCGAPANSTGYRDLGLIHQALMTGMTALSNSKIYYIFGDSLTSDFSKEYIFNVPPAKGATSVGRGTRVILFDDFGRGTMDDSFTWYEYGRPAYNTSRAVAYEVAQGTVDAVYIGGDISYAVGYLAVWDFFLEMIAPFTSGSLFFSNLGNHESDSPHSASFYDYTDSGGECGVVTSALLPLPYPATVNKPWWSYDVGLIHMLGMSTEHDYRVGSDQYNWIAADLAAVDRTVTPWIIFGAHRPMYISSNYGGPGYRSSADINVMNLMIASIEPLLFKYRVNVAFYGHNHVVQRQSAVYNKTVVQHSTPTTDALGNTINAFTNPSATVHMVVGTGGAGFTKNAIGLTPSADNGLAIPVWNEKYFYKWGYARVEAVDSTHLDWKWVEATSGIVYEHTTLTQSADWASQPWSLTSAGVANTKYPTATPSSAPSGPTAAPTAVSVVTYNVQQSLVGVTGVQANQTAFKYAYSAAVGGLLNVAPAMVVIHTILDTSTASRTRSLLTAQSSVVLYLTVKKSGAATRTTFVTDNLKSAVSQSQIINGLSGANNGYTVTSVSDASVSTAMPSAAPTLAPVPVYILPNSCFAGSETVTMQSGEIKSIAEVKVGDVVLAATTAGKTVYSEVVYVPHGANKENALFAHMTTESGRDVKMTMNHILPAGVCGSTLPLVCASKVSVGDCIQTVSGQESVASVMTIQGEGVYTIVTKEEFVVVNGIIASSFGANHMMANLYYNIHRFAYAVSPLLLSSPLLHSTNEMLGMLIPLFSTAAKSL